MEGGRGEDRRRYRNWNESAREEGGKKSVFNRHFQDTAEE